MNRDLVLPSIRFEDVKSRADEIQFLRTNTNSFKFRTISEGSHINHLWTYYVLGQ